MSHAKPLPAANSDTPVVPMQPASIDIWQQKYQLKNRRGEAVH